MSVSIQVAVRCRPFSVEDKLGVFLVQNEAVEVSTEGGEIQLLNSTYSTTRFAFSYAWWSAYGWERHLLKGGSEFPGENEANAMKLIDQNAVYRIIGQKIKGDLLTGNAVVMFAYGLSGSGKTFTVFGPDAEDIPEAWFKHNDPHPLWGLFPHLAYELFNERGDGWKISMKYFQNVVDIVRDLMDPIGKEQIYKTGMRKDPDGFMDIEWCQMKILKDWRDLRATFLKANARKAIAPTQFNHQSTRGHCIMVLELEMPHPDREGMKQRGRLYVCDLAGTEPAGDICYANYERKQLEDGTLEYKFLGPHNDPVRTKELQDQGKKINLSLSEMAQFFMKMADAIKKKLLKPGQKCIPGCNSYFLCKYLKDTMMQARTYLFCAVRPEARFLTYTFSTLNFAKNASVIKLQPKKAMAAASPAERRLMAELEKMKQLVDELKRANAEIAGKAGGDDSGGVAELQAALEEKQKQLFLVLSGQGGQDEENAEKALQQQQDEYATRGISLPHFAGETLLPHMVNLDEDSFRSRRFMYLFTKEATVFGPQNDIQLNSLMLVPDHCSVRVDKDGKQAFMVGGKGDCFHNGKCVPLGVEVPLQVHDRIVIANDMMIFMWSGHTVPAGQEEAMEAAGVAGEFRQGMMELSSKNSGDMAEKLQAFEKEKEEFEKLKQQMGGAAAGAQAASAAAAAGSSGGFGREEQMKIVDKEIMDILPRIADLKNICVMLNRPSLSFETNLQRSDSDGVPKVKVKVVLADEHDKNEAAAAIYLDTYEFTKSYVAHTVAHTVDTHRGTHRGVP
jgi:hypothetical protein